MRQILLMTIALGGFLWAIDITNFSRDGNTGIVTDGNTGLQWQDDTNVTKTWEGAIEYCEELTLGGHSDWRLPNFNELYSIVDKKRHDPALDGIFEHVALAAYWSATTVGADEARGLAWDVYFNNNGSGHWDDKSDDSEYVRCVRIGQ